MHHGAIPARTIVELLAGHGRVPGSVPGCSVPLLVQHGTADTLVPLSATRPVYELLGHPEGCARCGSTRASSTRSTTSPSATGDRRPRVRLASSRTPDSRPAARQAGARRGQQCPGLGSDLAGPLVEQVVPERGGCGGSQRCVVHDVPGAHDRRVIDVEPHERAGLQFEEQRVHRGEADAELRHHGVLGHLVAAHRHPFARHDAVHVRGTRPAWRACRSRSRAARGSRGAVRSARWRAPRRADVRARR